MPFYAEDAPVPTGLRTDEFVLRMLRATDVALDYDAVMASKAILHLRSAGEWPRADFTLQENLADLERHEAEFHARTSFTYTVMNLTGTECLGCVYIYPLEELRHRAGIAPDRFLPVEDGAAEVSFWVRQSRIADDLDRRLLAALLPWLRHDFAFARLYLRAYARETRQTAILREAGLRLVYSHPVGDSELLLFA